MKKPLDWPMLLIMVIVIVVMIAWIITDRKQQPEPVPSQSGIIYTEVTP